MFIVIPNAALKTLKAEILETADLNLSPEGSLFFMAGRNSSSELAKIETFFTKGDALGLLHLGLHDFTEALPPAFVFWQEFARRFITKVCRLQGAEDRGGHISIHLPDELELKEFAECAPFMRGAEYLSTEMLAAIWLRMETAFRNEIADFSGSLQEYLCQYNSRWNLVGRVCFHLAENKNNLQKPFAYLATYTTASSHGAHAQHLPLKKALQQSSAEKTSDALLALLVPVQKAAARSPFVKHLVDTGMIFEAVAWTAKEAHQFLQEIPLMEASGIIVRMPNWWNCRKPPRLKAKIQLGERGPSMLGLDSLLDFDIRLALSDGSQLTREEWSALQGGEERLVKLKGQWVEVDRKKLNALLAHWDCLKQSSSKGISIAEGLRLLAGMEPRGVVTNFEEEVCQAEWAEVKAGTWLKSSLDQLKSPQDFQEVSFEDVLHRHLRGTLRLYQRKGVHWLWILYRLRLGGCLADDMGLGKTIQILAFLLAIKEMDPPGKPHLLIVPASLIGNWLNEAARFAPSLIISVAHTSAAQGMTANLNCDLVITTYAFVSRWAWIKETKWDLVILDEAQAIKNPGTKQTLAVKGLHANVRLALTGTPIENRLGDLWSLFDFTSKGLLGSKKTFDSFAKQSGEEGSGQDRFTSALRKLTQPYILRRLKSDKNIISDLPDKTEMKTYCQLSRKQIGLYRDAIEDLAQKLKTADGMQRKGIVLSSLLCMKQICNHPAQWLGMGDFVEEESGKWSRLREICEALVEKQEKVLVFTQFTEIMPPLFSFLSRLFGREGLMLHGKTPVVRRAELVQQFQQDQGPPFFLLSLRAGGTGLNLTNATHVIHFDRWWNPAVENQATDRAYRIGQKHPVFVHQFICRGTVEEKIDVLIDSKKQLSKELLTEEGGVLLTELSNEEVLQMVTLDLERAIGEE